MRARGATRALAPSCSARAHRTTTTTTTTTMREASRRMCRDARARATGVASVDRRDDDDAVGDG
jgi:hypothetical protein